MTAPFALFQFRSNPEVCAHELRNYCDKAGLPPHAIDTYNVLDVSVADLDLSKYRGFFFGGSGEVFVSEQDKTVQRIKENLGTVVDDVVAADIPALFVCLGLHLLADAKKVPFYARKQYQEIGTVDVTTTSAAQEDPILTGIPLIFAAQTGHQDSIQYVPSGATLLAYNGQPGSCHVQAFRFGRNVYAVQFHPEMGRVDVLERLDYYPGYAIDFPLRESPDAPKMVRNFVRNVARIN